MALWSMGSTTLLYCWIAIGSALGGVTRYWCTGIAARISAKRPLGHSVRECHGLAHHRFLRHADRT